MRFRVFSSKRIHTWGSNKIEFQTSRRSIPTKLQWVRKALNRWILNVKSCVRYTCNPILIHLWMWEETNASFWPVIKQNHRLTSFQDPSWKHHFNKSFFGELPLESVSLPTVNPALSGLEAEKQRKGRSRGSSRAATALVILNLVAPSW